MTSEKQGERAKSLLLYIWELLYTFQGPFTDAILLDLYNKPVREAEPRVLALVSDESWEGLGRLGIALMLPKWLVACPRHLSFVLSATPGRVGCEENNELQVLLGYYLK